MKNKTKTISSNTRINEEKSQIQFSAIQEQMKNKTKTISSNTRINEEKSQIQFPAIQEQMKKNHKCDFQQYKNKMKKNTNTICNKTRAK